MKTDKRAYQFTYKTLEELGTSDNSIHRAIYEVAAAERRFRHADLNGYGMTDDGISAMVDSDQLKEIEISGSVRSHLASYHKFRYDPDYCQKVLKNAAKMRSVPVPLKVRRANIEKAQQAWQEKHYHRLALLFDHVIIPDFFVKGRDDIYHMPKTVSIKDVEEAVLRRYNICSQYPRDVYAAVMKEVGKLGIAITPTSVSVKRTWQRKVKDDKLVETLRERAQLATGIRLKLYAENPELEQEHIQRRVSALMEKLRTNRGFRRQTLRNLAGGNPALWKKYRSDPVFREKMKKKQIEGLKKGLATIKKRTAERQHVLYNIVIEEFGNLCNMPRNWMSYLQQKRPDFVGKQYRSYAMLKKDMAQLRSEHRCK